MSTDFCDAAKRHMADAELLMEKSHWANADHLFGIASECAIKQVMISLGMATHPDGNPVDRAHRVHMPDLWAAFHSFAQGRLASRYLEPLSPGSPYSNWSVDQRYARRGDFSEAQANDHQLAAEECMASLMMMLLDGGMN